LNHPEATHPIVKLNAVKAPFMPASTRSAQSSPVSSSTGKEAAVKRSPLSNLLNSTTIDKPKVKVTTGKARVLTSAECLKILHEKENKKH